MLLGDAEGAARAAPNGTGRVLQSGPSDRLFVFYSDHGAPGLLGMPSGPPLYADQLVGALLNMTRRRDDAAAAAAEEEGEVFSPHRHHRRHHHHEEEKKRKKEEKMLPGNATFSEIVLFVEACEAGSMFEGMLPSASGGDGERGETGEFFPSSSHRHRRRFHRDDGRGIFALTAANPHESSWGVYCPGMPSPEGSPPLPEGFDTCLGDLFAVSWMRAAEDPAAEPAESLEELARVVARATSRNGTFEMGSHVSEYGDRREEREGAAAFLGVATGGGEEEDGGGGAGRGRGRGGDGSEMRQPGKKEFSPPAPRPPSLASSAVPQRTADLLHLRLAASRGDGRSPGAEAAREALELELRHRETVDGAAAAVAAVLLLGGGGSGGGGGSSGSGGGRGGQAAEGRREGGGVEVSRRLAEELSELHGIEEGGPGGAAEAVAALVEAPLFRRRREGKAAARLASSSLSPSSSSPSAAPPPPPVVDDWDCLRAGVRAFAESPGCAPPPSKNSSSSPSQYALRHSKLVARACNAGTGAEEISEMVATACAGAARVASA